MTENIPENKKTAPSGITNGGEDTTPAADPQEEQTAPGDISAPCGEDTSPASVPGEHSPDLPPKDIWDRIMRTPLLRWLYPFYHRHKQVLLYLFFGAVTTVVSIGSYYLFEILFRRALGGDREEIVIVLSNVLSWFLAVLVAFLTNRVWVFDAKTKGAAAYFLQMGKFYVGRVATLVIETLLLLAGKAIVGYDHWAAKLIAQIIVLILNFVFSKWLIFRKKKA